MIYFLTIGSLQGLLLYSSKWWIKEVTDNYHPLSVISIIGKVFERIIYYQLFANLSDHNTLSVSTNLESMCSIQQSALLETCIDIGNVNAVAFLDLKKAFDTNDHDILVSKLYLYSISAVTP